MVNIIRLHVFFGGASVLQIETGEFSVPRWGEVRLVQQAVGAICSGIESNLIEPLMNNSSVLPS